MRRGRTAALAGAAFVAAGLARERVRPSACPYSQRWMLRLPRPLITTSRLLEVLEPAPGERLLEVGPGVGVQTIPVARCLVPDGTLDVLDLQQEMLDDLMRAAAAAGVSNLRPSQGSAERLPYEDASFDGAFLVTVLGEIPDQQAGLGELARVLRPGGRLVAGELVVDPHFVRLPSLVRRAEAAGLRLERRLGPPFGYYARFSRI